MAVSVLPSSLVYLVLSFLVVLLLLNPVSAFGRRQRSLAYHGGPLLSGNLDISILWYGPVPPLQRTAIKSFLDSINMNGAATSEPQVSQWWQIVESYQSFTPGPAKGGKINVRVVKETDDPNYSLGKVLIKDFIKMLLPKTVAGPNTIALIVAAKGVSVQDMCSGKCFQHDFVDKQVYVAVGDPEEECPECAFPLGPKFPPPSGDIGADAMVMSLAGGLAGAVTNPYGDGFYASARNGDTVDTSTLCKNIFGTGATRGNPGKLRTDPQTHGVFNAQGAGLQKFLLPALWNPATRMCWTTI